MSQDELAEKVYVTRQAVSRWKIGETISNKRKEGSKYEYNQCNY